MWCRTLQVSVADHCWVHCRCRCRGPAGMRDNYIRTGRVGDVNTLLEQVTFQEGKLQQ